MEELLIIKPLLKSRARKYSRYGLEYEDIFQQGALLFIIGVYEHQTEKERSPTAFSSYIKRGSTGDYGCITGNILNRK